MQVKRKGAQKLRRGENTPKRRTTLTLPETALREAEQLASARNVNLSTVVSEALADGLRLVHNVRQSDRILQDYRRAFEGFNPEETMLLDGIILEPGSRR